MLNGLVASVVLSAGLGLLSTAHHRAVGDLVPLTGGSFLADVLSHTAAGLLLTARRAPVPGGLVPCALADCTSTTAHAITSAVPAQLAASLTTGLSSLVPRRGSLDAPVPALLPGLPGSPTVLSHPAASLRLVARRASVARTFAACVLFAGALTNGASATDHAITCAIPTQFAADLTAVLATPVSSRSSQATLVPALLTAGSLVASRPTLAGALGLGSLSCLVRDSELLSIFLAVFPTALRAADLLPRLSGKSLALATRSSLRAGTLGPLPSPCLIEAVVAAHQSAGMLLLMMCSAIPLADAIAHSAEAALKGAAVPVTYSVPTTHLTACTIASGRFLSDLLACA
jgi:hypothetical protein